MLSILPLLTLALAPITPSAALDAPTRHVRGTTSYIDWLLKSGFSRSPTFAHLMSRIEQSDVIVYVEVLPALPRAIDGRLLMMARAHDNRYLRIQIVQRAFVEDTIALLGHELQHAAEIAEAPGVSDEPGVVALYERIGMRKGWHEYDTAEAQAAGRQVRKELA